MRIPSLAVFIAILSSPAVAAVPPTPMTPSGPWHVDFANSMCVLDRPYGADGAVKLILKPSMIGNNMEVIVARTTTTIADVRGGKAVIAVAGKTIASDTYFTAYSTAKARLIRAGFDEDDVDLATISGTISVDAKGEKPYSFAIPGIERALPVLAKCLEQLRTIYKVREADVGAVSTKPKGPVLALFSNDDYPREALDKNEWGTVGALIWVEVDGRVSSCQIIESNASKSLEKSTCDVVRRRARFAPAINAAKQAVRFPYFFRVRWLLPSYGAF